VSIIIILTLGLVVYNPLISGKEAEKLQFIECMFVCIDMIGAQRERERERES
jgi:hypothetical protein